MPDTLTDQYWRLPPISRTLATWMFVTSIGVHAGFIPFEWFMYNKFYLRFPPQLWRLVTGFLITGPGLAPLYDTYFFFDAASYIERCHPRMRRKEDFIWYLICIFCFIVIIDYFVAIVPFWTLTHGLNVALTYTATQQQQGRQVNHIFIPFRFPAPLTPYAMILINLLVGDRSEFYLGMYGLVAAHLWEFLTRIYPELGGGPSILKTPKFMASLVRMGEGRRRQYFSSSGTTGGNGADAASGSGSSPLPDSWKTKGGGRHLG